MRFYFYKNAFTTTNTTTTTTTTTTSLDTYSNKVNAFIVKKMQLAKIVNTSVHLKLHVFSVSDIKRIVKDITQDICLVPSRKDSVKDVQLLYFDLSKEFQQVFTNKF